MSEMDKDILKDNKKKKHPTNKNEKNKSKQRSKKRSNRNKKINQNKTKNPNITKRQQNNKKQNSNTTKKQTVNTIEKITEFKQPDNNPIINNNDSNIKENKSNINVISVLIIFILILVLLTFAYKINYNKRYEAYQNNLKEDIKKHYNEYVKTNKETDIYILKDNKHIKSGKISNNQELSLEKIDITPKNEYLKITTFDDEYYIYYKDIDSIEHLTEKNTRYKNYILFNENIITKNTTNFYNENNQLVYTFNKSFEFPIIIKNENIYGIEFNNQLLYIKQEDILEIKENKNTEKTNTSGIAVLNYHFFYDETKASERADCNQIICHSKSLFTSHINYIKENNIFTPTMKEFEMYLDKKINLPKSVLLTIDDGWRTIIAEEILEKNEVNATIFLITSWFEDIFFINNYKYIEYHSHGDNLHNQGICPGGQGGAIKCLEKNKLQADLKLSREKLKGTTVFCYPFYEYNNYSIENLKEAGFTMAFALGQQKASPGVDKYKIPRYVIYNNTSASIIASYIN